MDTSAWKVDDKAWMKERRAKWKEIQLRLRSELKKTLGVKAEDIPLRRDFFLTGQISEKALGKSENIGDSGWRRWNPEEPMRLSRLPIFLECWLHADDSEENWQAIKSKYGAYERFLSNTQFEFLQILSSPHLDGGVGLGVVDVPAPFCGLEWRFYQLLFPTRCRPEDYPELAECEDFEKRFAQRARYQANIFSSNMVIYMKALRPDPHRARLVWERLPEWLDAIGYWYKGGLEYWTEENAAPNYEHTMDGMIEAILYPYSWAKILLAHPDDYHPDAVIYAQRIDELLHDESLPQSFRDKVEAFRQRPLSEYELRYAGAKATFYIRFSTAEQRERYMFILCKETRPKNERELIRLENQDIDLGLICSPLMVTRYPDKVEALGELFLIFSVKMGIEGKEEFEVFTDALDKLEELDYCFYLDNHEEQQHFFYEAYLGLHEEYKTPKYENRILYTMGDDEALDAKIGVVGGPQNALKLMIDKVKDKRECEPSFKSHEASPFKVTIH